MNAYTIAAALSFAATADDNAGSCWNNIAGSVAGCTADAAKVLCETSENQWKADNNATAIPSTYRSNKAVAMKAIKLGVSLLKDGAVRGKSEVEKECKAMKSAMEKFEGAIETLVKIYNTMDGDDQQVARSALMDVCLKMATATAEEPKA